MALLTNHDSVFGPILAQFTKPHPFASDKSLIASKEIHRSLDELENNFAAKAMAVVNHEADKLVKSLQGKKPSEINQAKWNIIPNLQQLMWFLWRDGWQLGQSHAHRELKIANFTSDLTLAEFEDEPVVKVDATAKKRDRRIKTSKKFGNQAAYISDGGAPLEQSVLRQAIEDRSLSLAKDVDETTLAEIKKALVAGADPKNPLSPKEVEARINLALGRQVNRAKSGSTKAPRTKIAKTGGGFFSRAKMIARTELSGAYATARLSAFQAAGVTHVRWLSLEDLQRCMRCASRHGMVVALSDTETLMANPIPLHPYCRCLWVPVPNDGGGDGMRNDPSRSPGGMSLVPIAATWALGRGIIGSLQKQQQPQKQKNNFLRNAIIGGAGALSLAALYFLVLKNKNIDLNKVAERTINKIVDQTIQKQAQEQKNEISSRSSISNNIDKYPNRYTARQVLSPETLTTFPALAVSDADLSKITIQDLIRLTGLQRKDAITFKEQILEWIRQQQKAKVGNILALPAAKGELTVSGVDINSASLEQLINVFRLPPDKAAKIKAYIDAGNQINNFADLKKVPGIGQASAAKLAASLSTYRPNINTVPNTEQSVIELAAQLGIGPKLAQEILNERDRGGNYQNLAELTQRVKDRLTQQRSGRGGIYLSPGAIDKISQRADIFSPGATSQASKSVVRVGKQPEPKNITPASQRKLPPVRNDNSQKSGGQATTTTSPPPKPDNRLTPTVLGAAPKGRNRVLPPPRPEAPPSSKFVDLDNNYQNLSNDFDNYHASVAANIPKNLTRRTQTAFAQQDTIARSTSQAYTRASDLTGRLPDEVAAIENQVLEMERAYTQFLNPLNEPYFDNAVVSSRNITRQLDKFERNLDRLTSYDERPLAQINSQLEKLQALRDEIAEAVNTADTAAARSGLSGKIKNFSNQVSKLPKSPATQQLQEQIAQLADGLELSRDRNIAAINNRIAELEKISANIRTDTSGVKQRIADAKRQLQNLRSRLESLPKNPSQISETARKQYNQSRRVANASGDINRKINTYRQQEAANTEKIQQLTSSQQQAVNDYQLRHNTAINNVAAIVERTRASINQDMQLLKLMSGQEGVNWVMSKVNAGDGALQVLQQQAGIRSITTIEEAARFRDYAMERLHANIIAKTNQLQQRLDYPSQVTQDFLTNAKTTATELSELQKQVVVESQVRAKGIIESMDDWEDALSLNLAGTQGKTVNPEVRNAKNQIIQEVTQRRLTSATDIQDAIENNIAWRKSLEKVAGEDTVFDIKGIATAKSQIMGEVQALELEAQRLRSLNQVEVVPVQSPETLARKEAGKLYRARISQLGGQMQQIQVQLGKVTRQIAQKQQSNSPTGKLEAEKRQLEQQLANLMQQVADLDNNRGFSRLNTVTRFSRTNRYELPKILGHNNRNLIG